MEITAEEKEGVSTVRIEGDLTIYNAQDLKKALIESISPCGKPVCLDLSGAGEMDTAGFQLLYLAFREARKDGVDIRISGASPQVSSIIGLYGMMDYFCPKAEKNNAE